MSQCVSVFQTGSERRTRRWPSSSDWSWCLWRRSSKSHKVSDCVSEKHSLTSAVYSFLSPSLSPFYKILQSPRDRSQSLLPTNRPSPSQEWPSSKIAAAPPSVPSCNCQKQHASLHHAIHHFLAENLSSPCLPLKPLRDQVHMSCFSSHEIGVQSLGTDPWSASQGGVHSKRRLWVKIRVHCECVSVGGEGNVAKQT